MSVYTEIAQFASGKAALYVGAKSFSTLALTSFRNALHIAVGSIQQLAVAHLGVGVRFDSATAGIGVAQDVQTRFEVAGVAPANPYSVREIDLRAIGLITLDFSLGVIDTVGGFSQVLTKLRLEIRDLRFSIDASALKLKVAAGDARITPTFKREPNFNDTIQQYGLDAETVTRVEGMLLYGGLASAITQTVATPQEIDLKRLFPAVSLDGKLLVGVSLDQQYLFLTGSHGMIGPAGDCECADPGNGIGPTAPGEIHPGQDDPAAGAVGTITIGGPTPVVASKTILGRRSHGYGDSGIYIPNAMAAAMVQGPFPAIRFDVLDNGFIGWKAAALVDFNSFHFTPEPAHGRFYVKLGFRIEAYGSIHIDLGKLGKIRVTSFSAEQAGPGQNEVKIGFYAVLGTKGLYLKPVLEDVDFGLFEVHLAAGTLIGTPFGGWGAVIGFIFDQILSLIIASQIPIHLELELKRYMAKAMIPLLSATYAAEIEGTLRGDYPLLAALYDGGPEGFLFSAGAEKG
jgi:hypothetical protein